MNEAIEQAGTDEARQKQATESRKALVKKWTSTVKEARTFWQPVFERMREDIAFAGGDQWSDAEERLAGDGAEDKYQVNFVQREINQEKSAIYAKNPVVKCERRQRLEYTAWDGTDEQLQQAQMVLQQALPVIQAAQQAQQFLAVYQQEQAAKNFLTRDLNTPEPVRQAQMVINSVPPEVIEAQAVVADFNEGLKRKKLLDKVSATSEIILNYQLDDQQPDFEAQMKSLVLREKTTAAGFVVVKFQRQNESVITESATRADVVNRLQRVQQMLAEQTEDELSDADKEALTLEMAALQKQTQAQQGKTILEGCVLDFKPTTSVIVDPKCRNLFKFVGADWIAEEFMLTPEQVEAQWGADIKNGAVNYVEGAEQKNATTLNTKAGGSPRDGSSDGTWPEKAKCCVWIIYDKQGQMQYTICDGHEDFLEEPEAPWPAVKGFWPVVALKLTDIEVEENDPKRGITCYGQSAVRLMRPMQEEVNRSQEALRQHRIANKPGHICGKDTFDKNDRQALAGREAHDVVPLSNVPPGGDCSKVLWPVPVNTIDPALYRTDGIMQQVMLVVGSQQANLGQQAADEKATGQAIAEQSRIMGVSSEVDSLDKFLCEVVRIMGEMNFQELSLATAKKIAGPGGAWPDQTEIRASLNAILYLKIEAGSMGRPNRTLELQNWNTMLPRLMELAQAKGLPLDPLVKAVAKVMEFDFDLDEWLAQAKPEQSAGAQGKGASESISIKLADLTPEERAQALQMAGIQATPGAATEAPPPNQPQNPSGQGLPGAAAKTMNRMVPASR